MSNKLTVGRPIKGPPYRKFICKPPPPHRRTVRPGVGVRFFFKDSPRSERSRRSFQKEDTRGPRGFLKTSPAAAVVRPGRGQIKKKAFFYPEGPLFDACLILQRASPPSKKGEKKALRNKPSTQEGSTGL